MTSGCACDAEYAAVCAGYLDGLPLSERDRVSAETCGTFRRGEHLAGFREEGTAGVVEVVVVMIVTEKDDVDGLQLVGFARGALKFMQRHRAGLICASRWVEGGVSQETKAVQLENGG